MLLVVASSPTMYCGAGPGARAPCKPRTEEHPGTAPAGRARWGLRDDMGLSGAFKASSNPPVPFQDAWEDDRQRGCSLPVHPKTHGPGGAAEAWRVGPACQPCAYLLSARSVLLPTSMMITSLPRSVLTSSIHLEVCWKELRSGDGKGGKTGSEMLPSLAEGKGRKGQQAHQTPGGAGAQPHRPVGLGLPQEARVGVWSCCPRALESPWHC